MPHGGPFLANLFSLLRPTPMEVTTPPELLPFGWTATDLWATPLVAGLYATLTHAQPFFTYLHALLFVFLSPFGLATLSDLSSKQDGSPNQSVVAPLDTKAARAVCAVVLCLLYVNRAMRMYGSELGETITQITGALSTGEPISAPSTVEEEKIDKSPEEETVDTRRRGRVETLTSRGRLDDSIKFQADHNRRWAQGEQSHTSPPTTPCLNYSQSFTASRVNGLINFVRCRLDTTWGYVLYSIFEKRITQYDTGFARLGSVVDFTVLGEQLLLFCMIMTIQHRMLVLYRGLHDRMDCTARIHSFKSVDSSKAACDRTILQTLRCLRPPRPTFSSPSQTQS